MGVDRQDFGNREATAEKLEGLGAQVEWSSPSLLAIDVRDQEHAQEVADYLHEQEIVQRLMYETGKRA